MLRFCTLPPNADRATIEAKISEMRTRQLLSVIPSTAAEVGEDVDALLDAWVEAPVRVSNPA